MDVGRISHDAHEDEGGDARGPDVHDLGVDLGHRGPFLVEAVFKGSLGQALKVSKGRESSRSEQDP